MEIFVEIPIKMLVIAMIGTVLVPSYLEMKDLSGLQKDREKKEELGAELVLETLADNVREEIRQMVRRQFNKQSVEKVVEIQVENPRLRILLEKVSLNDD